LRISRTWCPALAGPAYYYWVATAVASPHTEIPPGPKLSPFASLTYSFGRDPLTFLTKLAKTYGDLSSYRLAGERIFFVNDPQHIKDILVTHQRNFAKSRGLERAKALLGNGLLTSEGAIHQRQHRLIQPAFHRERIASYARAMVACADHMQQGWANGASLDMSKEMMRLTMSIVGRTLFDVDVESKAADVGRALTEVIESFWMMMTPFADVMARLPFGPLRRAQRARGRLDAIIYGLIADRRRAARDRHDLLSMLVLAQDAEDGGTMTDQQVRDEAMTIFVAGHETTAVALMWTWYLLSQSPDVEARLHEEIDRALGSRLPTAADVPALAFVERVVTEAMRLYPPAWMIGRRAIEPYPIAGYVAPARTIFLMSQWVMHRNPRFFPEPDRFAPDRWTPAFKAGLPRFAYFPFGGGPRQCIGESFAWMELILVVATLAQQWRFRLEPGHPVVPRPLVTLRAKNGMRMVVEKRTQP
jgi:cytochrome P450